MRLSDKPGVYTASDHYQNASEAAQRVQDLIEGARTFQHRIEIIIDNDDFAHLGSVWQIGCRVRSFHEPRQPGD